MGRLRSDVDVAKSVGLASESPLKKGVWKIRTTLRDSRGEDTLNDENVSNSAAKRALKKVYKKADAFMEQFFPSLKTPVSKKIATQRVRDVIDELGYTIVDIDETKPWGAYYRFSNDEAERFVSEFFPGLSMNEARLGHDDIELSPKLLLVSPGQRLSWQLHHRRAERWRFLTQGSYYQSDTDEMGDEIAVQPDDIVQFSTGQRHRLVGSSDTYTLAAEIWQHTDTKTPSNEADIVRIQDDYSR